MDFCRDGNLCFSVGFDPTEPIRAAILDLGQDAWAPALTQDGHERDDGAWVAEITERLDLTGWPAGSRVIVRRERPHPGAQLSFTDHDGHRFQAILTDQPDPDIAYLEARHRGHARVEDRIKAGKDTGMAKLPFRDFAMNTVWLEISLIAQDLLAWTTALCLDGELARSEPKRLRYRLLHTGGRLAFHARQATLHLDRDWALGERTRHRLRVPRGAAGGHSLKTAPTHPDDHPTAQSDAHRPRRAAATRRRFRENAARSTTRPTSDSIDAAQQPAMRSLKRD